MFKPLTKFLDGALKVLVWGLLGIALLLALASCSASEMSKDNQQQNTQTAQDQIAEDLREHIITADNAIDPPATNSPSTTTAKQAQLYPDLPAEVEAEADERYCCRLGKEGTLLRTSESVQRYKDEHLMQEWARGELPEERFLMTRVDKNIYLVEDNELVQLNLDGTANVISDEVMDVDVPYAGYIRALYFQNGALIWWSHDDYGTRTTLVANDLGDVEEAGFGCSSVLITKSDGTYVWLRSTYEGEFNDDQLYTFCRIGGSQSIEYWREVWNDYATFFSQAPCLSEFIAYCTTPMYSFS